jgi:hypothetical protein
MPREKAAEREHQSGQSGANDGAGHGRCVHLHRICFDVDPVEMEWDRRFLRIDVLDARQIQCVGDAGK